MMTNSKPEIRILHHMARSGGTVISRCIGSMDKVILLSEIHPLGRHIHSPLQQAIEWFRLFTDIEVQSFRKRSFTFIEAIETIRQRVSDCGDSLVVRDWSHLDFTAIPFLESPSYKLTLMGELSRHYKVIPAFTVRNPVDQWISLNNLAMFSDDNRPDPGSYIQGYFRFAEFAHKTGFVRYEDFSRNSDAALRNLCETLQLSFDSTYSDKWKNYNTITGDNTTPSTTSRGNINAIEKLPRQLSYDQAAATLGRYDEYYKALGLLGYQAG